MLKLFQTCCLVCDDAENITDFFEENEVNGIYLNFFRSLAKEKTCEEKTYIHNFSRKNTKIFSSTAVKYFSKPTTDRFSIFSLEQFALAGLEISDVTYDLHNSEYESENIHTEYENNFSAKGFSINRAVAAVDKKNNFADTGHDIENNKTKIR